MLHRFISTVQRPAWFSGVVLAVAVVLPLVAHAPAASAEQPLAGPALRNLVAGKRIYLATPLGGELPLHYRANGVVDGSGDAVGLGRFMKPKDSGRWWVTGNRLCQKWKQWYDGRTFCFTLAKLSGNKVRWTRDDGMRGVARIGG